MTLSTNSVSFVMYGSLYIALSSAQNFWIGFQPLQILCCWISLYSNILELLKNRMQCYSLEMVCSFRALPLNFIRHVKTIVTSGLLFPLTQAIIFLRTLLSHPLYEGFQYGWCNTHFPSLHDPQVLTPCSLCVVLSKSWVMCSQAFTDKLVFN